ncbi:hypothetical protein AABB24_003483 [Solanum stoloniferum]|uniref:F-box domain-containing protein n=1 Tax=Solanum stoloniferum TaxID=62892 RepID=A0ABD2VBR4_9SOLN
MNNATDTCVPHDVLLLIFSKLPVKDLLRLKLLNKRWHTEFSTPYYLHLNTFSSNPHISERSCSFLMKFTEPLNNVLDSSNFRMVGSIHGLVILAITCSHKLNCIWNPSLDEYMFLPTHNVNYEKTKSYVNIGMGFRYD